MVTSRSQQSLVSPVNAAGPSLFVVGFAAAAESPAAHGRHGAGGREGTGSCSAGTGACPRPPHDPDGRTPRRRGKGTGTDCCAVGASPSHDTSRIAWAKLLARVGEEFPLECPACGGDIRLIAFITEPGPIHATAAGRSRLPSNRRFASGQRPRWHCLREAEPPPISPARGPPTDWGESCSSTTTVTSSNRHLTSCLRSTSTASDRCRTPGHDKAPRRPHSERLRADPRKSPLQGGRATDSASRLPGRDSLGRRELSAHEPLIRRATIAEVPLTGLSLSLSFGFCVTLGYKPKFSCEQHRVFSILLGELASQGAAPACIELRGIPHECSGDDALHSPQAS
jgi:hypothetical protein